MAVPAGRNPLATFALRYALLLTLGLGALEWIPAGGAMQALCATLTQAAAWLLAVIDPSVVRTGADVLRAPGTVGIQVTSLCSGLEIVVMAGSAVLSMPVSRSARVAGLLLLTLLIQAINVVRLAVVAALQPVLDHAQFVVVHEFAWPFLMLVASAACFVAWVQRLRIEIARPAPAA